MLVKLQVQTNFPSIYLASQKFYTSHQILCFQVTLFAELLLSDLPLQLNSFSNWAINVLESEFLRLFQCSLFKINLLELLLDSIDSNLELNS